MTMQFISSLSVSGGTTELEDTWEVSSLELRKCVMEVTKPVLSVDSNIVPRTNPYLLIN